MDKATEVVVLGSDDGYLLAGQDRLPAVTEQPALPVVGEVAGR